MSEKEQLITETFRKVLPGLTEEKKEYLLGLGEGMAIMAERQRSDPPEKDSA